MKATYVIKITFCTFTFLLGSFLGIPEVKAQNTCTATNGNWGFASTWSNCGGTIPRDGDVVIIPDNITVIISASNQYPANSVAPLLYIYLGDDDGDGDGGTIEFNGKLNVAEGSTFIIYDNSSTVSGGSGSSDKIRWWDSGGAQVAQLSGGDVEFTGPITVTDGTSTPGINDPLPVSILYIEAERRETVVNIYWGTTIEENNDYFTIQRSSNGISWESIGKIDGAGNSNSLINYEFLDKAPLSTSSYYRIKQTDFDGQSSVSDVVYIKGSSEKELSYYPNPVQDILYVNGSSDDLSNIKLFNSNGIDVDVSFNSTYINENKLIIDVSSYPSGIYILTTSSQKQLIKID